MKLSLSTISCADWNLREIFASAKDLGYQGVEIRKLKDETYAPRMKPFLPERIDRTLAELRPIGLSIPLLASGAAVGVGDGGAAARECADYAALAKQVGASYIRVLAGARPGDPRCDLALARKTVSDWCGAFAGSGISLLIETNSVFADTKKLRIFLKEIGSDAVGALWDVHYPLRLCGEPPEETVETLGESLKYVHMRDSLMSEGSVRYCLMGHGDLPVKDCLAALSASGYPGYLSFEWIPKWSGELVEPGIAAAQYASYMQRALRALA